MLTAQYSWNHYYILVCRGLILSTKFKYFETICNKIKISSEGKKNDIMCASSTFKYNFYYLILLTLTWRYNKFYKLFLYVALKL